MQNNTAVDDELSQMIAGLRQKQAAVQSAMNQSAPAMMPGSKTIEPLIGNDGSIIDTGVDASGQPVSQNEVLPIPPAMVQPMTEPQSVPEPQPVASMAANYNDLSNIKQQAIVELRPLVDRLNLAPEDKFDIMLLLIRTTDDSSLIPLAHAEAMRMTDEVRRAQALLDIIKEIDFFGRNAR